MSKLEPIVETKYNKTKILIVGITHNSPISFERVKRMLETTNCPILLEYCKTRYNARIKRKFGFWSIMAKDISTIEEYVIKYCEKHNRPYYFIDQDVKITLKQLFGWNILEWLCHFIIRLLTTPKITKEEALRQESTPISEIVLPEHQYNVLVKIREEYMVKQIKQYIEQNKPKEVLVIVGKGHIPGLIQKLN